MDSIKILVRSQTKYIYGLDWPMGPQFAAFDLENGSTGFPGGAVVENLPANAGDTGSSPGLGGSHMPRSN